METIKLWLKLDFWETSVKGFSEVSKLLDTYIDHSSLNFQNRQDSNHEFMLLPSRESQKTVWPFLPEG